MHLSSLAQNWAGGIVRVDCKGQKVKHHPGVDAVDIIDDDDNDIDVDVNIGFDGFFYIFICPMCDVVVMVHADS